MWLERFMDNAGGFCARWFVPALVDSEKASAVLRGIVGLARSLSMKTIAEGVERCASMLTPAASGTSVSHRTPRSDRRFNDRLSFLD